MALQDDLVVKQALLAQTQLKLDNEPDNLQKAKALLDAQSVVTVANLNKAKNECEAAIAQIQASIAEQG